MVAPPPPNGAAPSNLEGDRVAKYSCCYDPAALVKLLVTLQTVPDQAINSTCLLWLYLLGAAALGGGGATMPIVTVAILTR